MEDGDDILGSLGLGKLLAAEGADASGLSSLLSRGGGGEGSGSAQFADLDNASDDGDAKYEDDLSDNDMPETAAEKAAREKERAEEARYKRMALQMNRELEESRARKGKGKAKEDPQAVVKNIWPDFEPGKRLRMSDVLYETPLMRRQHEHQLQKKKRRKVDTHTIHDLPRPSIPPDQTSAFSTDLAPLTFPQPGDPLYKKHIGAFFDRQWVKGAKDLQRQRMTEVPDDIAYNLSVIEEEQWRPAEAKALDLADWEKDIVMFSLDVPKPKRPSEPLQPRNDLLNTGDWLKDIIWDATRVSPDLWDEDDAQEGANPAGGADLLETQPVAPADNYNMSSDGLYEHSREARFRIRQTFGAIEVFHSQPAKSLQMPFYKTSLNKAEARAWRRPALQFPQGVPITLHKLKNNPSASVSSKKKQVMADPSERFKSTKDLTMSEKGPCVLLEFSEEYPPIMSGYGMGTTIVNYYRKKDDRDETVPKLDFGQPSILNPSDADPFMLGYVDRGKVTQVIHNNLIRAPIFQHKPPNTDFLVVRHTVNNQSTYYIRSINNLFTVGQTVPNESEVAGPHARKNTNTAKTRLMIVAWLLIQKSREKRIKLATLMKYFPDQTELQMRQRLKIKGNEFLVYARHPSPNVGYWLLNEAYDFPKDRKSVVEQCTPEQAMLYEAMQVGQRHLYDAGYAKTAEGNAEEEAGDDTILDVEQQLAVWATTKNYKLAEAAKAWLLLHGEGDPTGRGEGFSFLRTNMKNYFLRKGETDAGRRLEAEQKGQLKISNAEQNRIYEEEKRKVWDLQWKALSDPIPPALDAEDDRPMPTPSAMGPRFGRSESRRAMSRSQSLAATPFADSPREMSPSQYSADGESHFTGNPYGGKVLRIKRVVRGKEVVEIVRDPAVIQSYLKRVEERKILHFMKNPELLKPSGNPEEDELKRIALMKSFEKVKKNQERRLARKKYEARSRPDFDGELDTSKRRCGACGQVGHTKANRNCPMFNASSVAPSPVAATPAIPTPGTAAYGEYFAQTPGSETASTPSTSFKIRLGGFNKG